MMLAEERANEHEDILIETIQSEQKKGREIERH